MKYRADNGGFKSLAFANEWQQYSNQIALFRQLQTTPRHLHCMKQYRSSQHFIAHMQREARFLTCHRNTEHAA